MNRSAVFLWVLASAVLLAACSSKPPQRHEYSLLLDGLSDSASAVAEKTETLNIGRIDLPDFLQTRALAMQVSDNEIVMARHHGWAHSLDDSIAGVLKLALAAQRPQISVVESAKAACDLDVRFDRFHAAAEGEVLASGEYSLSKDGVSTPHTFDVSRTLHEDGYANAVSELRKSLTDLAAKISEQIDSSGGCSSSSL